MPDITMCNGNDAEKFIYERIAIPISLRIAQDRKLSYEAKGLLLDILSRKMSTKLRGFDLPHQFFVIKGKADISKIDKLFNELKKYHTEIVRAEEHDKASEYIESLRKKEPEARKPKSGYIYFLEGGGYVKIGKTTDLEKRWEQLHILLPFKVELIHSIESDDIHKDEEKFHKLYDSKRVNGEWFELSDDDMKEIKSL